MQPRRIFPSPAVEGSHLRKGAISVDPVSSTVTSIFLGWSNIGQRARPPTSPPHRLYRGQVAQNVAGVDLEAGEATQGTSTAQEISFCLWHLSADFSADFAFELF